jgi:hypothetical protein
VGFRIKKVIISSPNCFLSNSEILPFVKNEKRSGTTRTTYSWNNSYQNLKHDRANSLEYGSIKYLFDVTSALYILNIYYKDDIYDLEDNSAASNFDYTLGSSIYSVQLHKNIEVSSDPNIFYTKNPDYKECIYLFKPIDDSIKYRKDIYKIIEDDIFRIKAEIIIQLRNEKINPTTKPEELPNIINEIQERASNGDRILGELFTRNKTLFSMYNSSMKYEAILNKNQY